MKKLLTLSAIAALALMSGPVIASASSGTVYQGPPVDYCPPGLCDAPDPKPVVVGCTIDHGTPADTHYGNLRPC